MKNKCFAVALALLLTLVAVGTVSATPLPTLTIDVDTSQCGTATVDVVYNGPYHSFVVLFIWVGDDMVPGSGTYKEGTGVVSIHYEFTGEPGNYLAIASAYFSDPDGHMEARREFNISSCGEQCGRCSNVTPFMYVEWFDRDGGCDDDWWNERVEYPNDERCYSTCDVTIPVVQDPVWGPWSPWVYNPSNGLEESTRTGTQTTLFVDSIDEECVCDSGVEELSDYRSREVEYSLTVVGTGDCFNWEYVPSFTEGGEMSVVGELEGAWMDIYGPEIAPVPTVSVIWPSGFLLTVTPDAIAKDNECIQCLITPYYPQASYHDAAAPDVYWQGPFGRGSGVCNVIHPEGPIPSVGRVTTLCSLCPDVYDGGYIYQVNNMFYDGWVLKVQCYGQETHYTYMGYNWDKYVRDEYTTDGERLSCRVQGCANWIHENAE